MSYERTTAEPPTGYTPVPTTAAQALALSFAKDVVLVVAVDHAHRRTHFTTFGRTPADKLAAARLGEAAQGLFPGLTADGGEVFEDFRLDAARLKEENDRLRAENAQLRAEVGGGDTAITQLNMHIEGLEAERDRLRALVESQGDRIKVQQELLGRAAERRLPAGVLYVPPPSPEQLERVREAIEREPLGPITVLPEGLTVSSPAATPIDEARVRAVLADSPLVEPDEWPHLVASANADPHEGVDWLPYYKLSAALLIQAAGMFGVLAQEAVERARLDPGVPTGRWTALRKLKEKAEAFVRLSLRPCGIRPDPTPERAAEVDALTAKLWDAAEKREPAAK